MLGAPKPQKTKEMFAREASEWIDGARQAARTLLRNHETVDIEDVLAIYPRPEYINRNITGQVFRHPDFEAVGYRNSRRPISRGNIIRTWRLAKYYEVTDID